MKSLTKKVFLLLVIQFVFSFQAGAEAQSSEKTINQVIQSYNSQNYSEALAILEKIKNTRDTNTNWYYYYALIQTRLNNYPEALENFEHYVKNSDATNVASARAYYYIGLIQFQRGEFEKAMNSLEIALDISVDPQLDTMTELLIDKTIRYQNYFESSKRTNITFLFGYNFDANAINLSPNFFDDNLNGNVFGYGVSASHKIVDRYKFVFEPTLAALDNYTFDSKFKANSTLQATDALQILVSLPFRFFFNEGKFSNRYDISLNGYSVYLPVASTTREISLSSVFLKTQILTPYSNNFAIRYNATLAADTAYGFTTEDDDSTGARLELLTTFTHFLSQQNINNMFYDIGADFNAAKGINGRFQKFSTGVGYMYPSLRETISSIRLGASLLNYPDKAEPRNDTQAVVSYNITKAFQSGSTLGFSASAVSNSSNIALNKYTDFVAGVQFTKSFGF